jgi:hypothetical protein
MVVNFWRKMNKDWLAAIIPAILIILVSLSSYVQYSLKSITDFLAVGVSDVKLYALLIFFFVAFMLRALKVRPSFPIRKSWVVCLIIFLVLFGFSLHLYYLHEYGFDFWQQTFTGHDVNFSGNQPDHSHIFKPVMVVLGGLIGQGEPKENYDNGFSTYLVMPHWPYYLGAALVVLLGLGLVFFWLKESRRREGNRDFGFDFIYLLSSFIVLKNVVDGGMFGKEFLLSFVVWLIAAELGRIEMKKLVVGALAAIPTAFCFSLAFYCLEGYFMGHPYYGIIFKETSLFFVLTMAVYALGFTSYLWRGSRRLSAAAVAVSAVVIIVFLSPFDSTTEYRDRYSGLTIGPNDYAVIATVQDLRFPEIAHEGDFKYYRLTTEKTETIADVSWQYGLPVDYVPVSISGKNCMKDLPSYLLTSAADVEVVKQGASFDGFKSNSSGVIKIIDWKLVGRRGAGAGYPVYEITFWADSCTPQPARTLTAFLSESGLDSFIFFRPDTASDWPALPPTID